jgi:hypothetical protein
MYLRLTPNLLHFPPDLDALYALRRAPNFYEIHPRADKKPVKLSVFPNKIIKNGCDTLANV